MLFVQTSSISNPYHFQRRCHFDCTALLNFPERREIAWKFDITATLVFLWCSMAFLRRSSCRLLALSWCSHGASTACIELSRLLRVNCAFTALPTALTAFCLHSEVVGLTSRVLISQLEYEPMPLTMHQPSAFVQSCSNPKVTTPCYPPPSSSVEPAFRQAIALLDGAQQFPIQSHVYFKHA